MDFSTQLKTARKELNLTQMQLAEAIGVSFSTVNRWENGQFKPSGLARKSFEEFCDANFISFAEGDTSGNSMEVE